MPLDAFGTATAASIGDMANTASPACRGLSATRQHCVNLAHCAGTATNPYLLRRDGNGPDPAALSGVAERYGSNDQFKVTKMAFSLALIG